MMHLTPTAIGRVWVVQRFSVIEFLLARWSARHVSHTVALLLLVLLTVLLSLRPASANPAFARKYGMRCSGCHVAWPLLNNFGQVFKDNGYQMMNDRDSPIWRDKSYWPIAMYGIPEWHRESSSNQPVDTTPGNGANQSAQRVTSQGFDFSGVAWWMSGTLNKNISFLLLPTIFTEDSNVFKRPDAIEDAGNGAPPIV